MSPSLGAITIEYKQYGVGLAFTPIVLSDGRISMRVRPEVSELSNEGAVKLNDFLVPALTTRRAETTVELGSGQSFMIAGLLRNATTNDINKAPFPRRPADLGGPGPVDLVPPSETELVSSSRLSGGVRCRASARPGRWLPRSRRCAEQFLGQTFKGVSGARAPVAVPAPPSASQRRCSGVQAVTRGFSRKDATMRSKSS